MKSFHHFGNLKKLFFPVKSRTKDSHVAPNPISGPEDDQLISLPRYQVVEIPFRGKKLRVPDPVSCYYAYKEIFGVGIYEFPTDKEKPRIIDCGANIGLSVIFFKTLYPMANIMAIEADPSIFDYLKKNLGELGFNDVFLIQKAVSGTNGDGTFFAEGADAGRLGVSIHGIEKSIKVQCTTLDELINDREVDFLKIDIEGTETDVILGCKNLHLVKNLFVEYHSFQSSHQSLHEILAKLAGSGFRYYINAPFCPKKPFNQIENNLGMDLQLNISCIRNDL
jgi:FkbM family methyltransferase